MVSVIDCRSRGLGYDSGTGQLLGFFQKILNNNPKYEADDVSSPCLGEHVKPSVPAVMNIDGIRY